MLKNSLIGTLLGDGRVEKRGNSARLRITHSIAQLPFAQWKHAEFGEYQPAPIRENRYYDKRTGKTYKSCRFATRAHPDFIKLHELFYRGRTKIVPEQILSLLHHPQALAVWYMDDGTINKKQSTAIFETQCFDKYGLKRLVEALDKNFGIKARPMNHGKGRKGKRLYISRKSSIKLFQLVEPYMIPSMRYKIASPVTTNSSTGERTPGTKR